MTGSSPHTRGATASCCCAPRPSGGTAPGNRTIPPPPASLSGSAAARAGGLGRYRPRMQILVTEGRGLVEEIGANRQFESVIFPSSGSTPLGAHGGEALYRALRV